MKTAISVPDNIFARASQRAAELGMTPSEFFSRATERYLDELDAQSLTEQIDAAIDLADGEPDADAHAAVAAGRNALAGLTDEWRSVDAAATEPGS